MNYKIPKKPKGQKEQVSILWDIVCNHIWTRQGWQDVKINFILILLGILMGLNGIILARMLTQ